MNVGNFLLGIRGKWRFPSEKTLTSLLGEQQYYTFISDFFFFFTVPQGNLIENGQIPEEHMPTGIRDGHFAVI